MVLAAHLPELVHARHRRLHRNAEPAAQRPSPAANRHRGHLRQGAAERHTASVGDVAYVVEGHQPLIGDAIIGEGPGLMVAIEKFPGFNTLEVTRGVERALDELKPGLPGIEINTTIYHPASFIERATSNLGKAAIISIILAAAALGLLMGSWRAAVIALAAISLSFVSAVCCYRPPGFRSA